MQKWRRFIIAVVVSVVSVVLFGTTGCTPSPTQGDPGPMAISTGDNFDRSGIPSYFADPLRNCGNDIEHGRPADFVPCLKQAWTIEFTNGNPMAAPLAGYEVVYLEESGTIRIKPATDQIFLVVKMQGNVCEPVKERDHGSDNYYPFVLPWSASQNLTLVVTTWDPSDRYNQSVNRRDVPVPCAWSDVIPQVLKLKQ